MIDDIDPEVRADIAKRDRIAAERSASDVDHMRWKPDRIAGESQCVGAFEAPDGRRTRCRVTVPVTADEIHAAETASKLNGRHLPPKVYCASCTKREADNRARYLRRWNDELAAMIREFKSLSAPCHEARCEDSRCRWHALIQAMRAHGSEPQNLDGLVTAVRERLSSNSSGASTKRGKVRGS